MNVTQPLLSVVDAQLKEGAATKETYDRLTGDGMSDSDARSLIAQVVARELENIISTAGEFDKDDFEKALSRLPVLDFSC